MESLNEKIEVVLKDISNHGVKHAQIQAIRTGFLHPRRAARLDAVEAEQLTVPALKKLLFF